MKRPAFQFYPADWRKDAALQSCSLAAQGLWINLMCIAHECEPYGHLTINGAPMASAQIGRLVGLSSKECERLIAELRDAMVCDFTDSGVMFSRRMVRDERIRNVRADAGRLGGNPALVGKKDKQKDNHPPNLDLTPSSSSSSSPSGIATSSEVAGHRADDPPLTLVGKKPDCPHLAILALWAEVLPFLPQHEPDQWRGARSDHLRARWRETCAAKRWQSEAEGLAYFRKLFAYVGQSQFLTGRVTPREQGRRPFTVTLGWLVKPENWAKTIEGEYHPEAA